MDKTCVFSQGYTYSFWGYKTVVGVDRLGTIVNQMYSVNRKLARRALG